MGGAASVSSGERHGASGVALRLSNSASMPARNYSRTSHPRHLAVTAAGRRSKAIWRGKGEVFPMTTGCHRSMGRAGVSWHTSQPAYLLQPWPMPPDLLMPEVGCSGCLVGALGRSSRVVPMFGPSIPVHPEQVHVSSNYKPKRQLPRACCLRLHYRQLASAPSPGYALLGECGLPVGAVRSEQQEQEELVLMLGQSSWD